ncbi:hypothetical protein H4217_008985, partial [Coemansia sp. RSA 1939]
NNEYIRKALLAGEFEIPLDGFEYDADGIVDFPMVPSFEDAADNDNTIIDADSLVSSSDSNKPLSGFFGFNESEVGMLLDKSSVKFPQITDHKDKVMATIKDWYGGYQNGKCSEKYNPRSVCAFIESFCSQLRGSKDRVAQSVPDALQSAAKVYWITTGKPGLIETLIDKHRDQAADTIEQLIGEYENRTSDDVSSKPASQSNHAVTLQLPKPDVGI